MLLNEPARLQPHREVRTDRTALQLQGKQEFARSGVRATPGLRKRVATSVRCGLNLLYMIPGVVGGTETYAAGLLSGLARLEQDHEYIVFLNRESRSWPLPEGSRFRKFICPVSASNRIRRYFYEQVLLPQVLQLARIDILHSLGYVSPLRTPCASVVTVHDLNFHAHREWMPRMKRLSLEFFVRRSARHAQRVITVSNFSRNQIVRHLGIANDKIVTIYEAGPCASSVKKTLAKTRSCEIPHPFIAAFSGSGPHKNVHRLVEAFLQARINCGFPHSLVLIGHPPDGFSNWNRLQCIHFLGYVDDATKWTVLSEADVMIFPSLYEGFGLPILEAQTLGVPVICSNAACLPEVAGVGALFFDPSSTSGIADALSEVLLNSPLRESLKLRGLMNVERFSWEQTASETLAVYRDAINMY